MKLLFVKTWLCLLRNADLVYRWCFISLFLKINYFVLHYLLFLCLILLLSKSITLRISRNTYDGCRTVINTSWRLGAWVSESIHSSTRVSCIIADVEAMSIIWAISLATATCVLLANLYQSFRFWLALLDTNLRALLSHESLISVSTQLILWR